MVGETNKIGSYCVLHSSTCVAGNGKVIGDGLYLATGAKITAKLTLGNNVTVAANAVVNKSFDENGILLAGVPASIKMKSEPWYIRDGNVYYERYKSCENLKSQMGLFE